MVNGLLSWWCRLFATRTGMNSVHAACDLMLPAPTNFTSFRLFHEVAPARCKTLKQAWCFTRLPATLWESSGLKALLWEAKAPVVATNAPPRWHRHFYKEELWLQNRGSSFFVHHLLLIPLVNSGPMVLQRFVGE